LCGVQRAVLVYHERMSGEQAYRRDNHCVYLCDYHIVFSTKYRRDCITPEIWEHLHKKLRELSTHYPKLYLKEANHDVDHVHLLISIPPQMRVCDVVRLVKTNTSRGIKLHFPVLKTYYWGSDGIWSDGYFVSTVGVNIEIIKRYIEKQGALDTAQTTLFD